MSRMTMEFQRMMDEMRKQRPQPSRQAEKVTERETKAAVIAATRQEVFRLDPACICGSCPPKATDEMHEVVPRSKLRGRHVAEIYNRRNCVRLSRECHALVTGVVGKGKGLHIKFRNKELGAMGPVRLKWKDGRRVIYQRKERKP